MKRLLIAVAISLAVAANAYAADLGTAPAPAPMYAKVPPPVAYSWTGFYIGGNVGYGWGDTTVAYTPNDPAALAGTCGGVGGGTCIPSASFNMSGVLAGGQIGYNWQTNANWLLGLESDLQWANIKGSASSAFHLGSTENTFMNAQETVEWFGTVRARVGFIPTNPLLLFATGGLAYGEVRNNLVVPNLIPSGTGSESSGGYGYICSGGGPPCFTGSGSPTNVGWTVGGGGEYMITPNITLKAEYLYVNLGHFAGTATATQSGGDIPASFTANFGTVSFSVARGGVNWKF